MEQKQIIHIATEVVVISGLAIYFKLKTNSLTTQVEELKKRLITQEQLIEEFKNRLDEQSLFLTKQDKLLTSLMIKQSLQPQAQPQVHYKQKSRSVPKQKVFLDSETDSTYFQEEKHSPSLRPPKIVQQAQRLRPRVEEQLQKTEQPRERQPERPIQKPRQIAPPSVHSENDTAERDEEDLDQELEKELFELQTVEDQKHSDTESEIIEIDTSLKKKA